MLVVIIKEEKIIDFKYFSTKKLSYYIYILVNKIRFRKVEVIE